MKNILFNKIILSIFFLLAGTAIAWTQGLVRYSDTSWKPRSAIVVNAKVKKISELELNKTENNVSSNSTTATLDKIN